MDEASLLQRVTMSPRQCGGRPCLRGMRIRVADVLDLLATGMNIPDILAELPDLEHEDVQAALVFARRLADHRTLVV